MNMKKPVLILACVVLSAMGARSVLPLMSLRAISVVHAAEPNTAVSSGKTAAVAAETTASNFQLMFYNGLVKHGVPPSVAALMTADTEILSEDDKHVHFVQTMVGGGKRDVKITLTPTEPGKNQQAPIALDDGSFVLAESISTSGTAGGYRMSATFFIPAASLPPDDKLKQGKLGGNGPWWLGLIGIQNAWAQGGGSGLTVGIGDSFSGTGPAASSTSGPSMQTVVQDASKAISDQGINLVKAAQEVAQSMEPKLEGPKTLWQSRADMVKNAAKVFDQGYKAYKTLKDDDAMRKKLRALKDCAEHPTAPTAKDAQKNDPYYRKATTEAIENAERSLKVNTTIKIIASTGNAIASTVLGSAGSKGLSKAVSILDKVEDKLLQHVADEYIMKDAGKGVVPCEPDCGDGYSPPVAGSQDAGQGSLSCQQPAPEELTCRAGPAHTPGPPPKPPAPRAVCGPLKHAEITFKFSSATSGCSAVGCFADTNTAYYSGDAGLTTAGAYGYEGKGRGSYRETDAGQNSSKVCSLGTHSSSNFGSGTVILHTSGYDDGPMPTDDSLVEVLLGYQFNHEEHTSGCDSNTSYSVQAAPGDAEPHVSCEFHGVDLTRPGFYRAFKGGDPQSGVCTILLSR